MFQRQRRKLFGSFGDREPSRVIRVGAASVMIE